MQDSNYFDVTQLITAKEAGEMKGMNPTLVAYHLSKQDAPKPVYVGKLSRHPYYLAADIDGWEPKRDPRKKHKNTRKGLTSREQ